jgi:hypothetical protein
MKRILSDTIRRTEVSLLVSPHRLEIIWANLLTSFSFRGANSGPPGGDFNVLNLYTGSTFHKKRDSPIPALKAKKPRRILSI